MFWQQYTIMKIKHLISSLLLSASLVTAGALFASQEKVEKAEAANNNWESLTLYYAASSQINGRISVNRGGVPSGSSQWEDENMTYTNRKCGSNFVYSATVWEYYGGFDDIYFKNGDTVLHHISGWTTRDTMNGKMYDGSSWASIFTVNFNMNGHGTAPNGQYAINGGKVTKPSDPTATGYTFGGWYKETGCTNAWNFSTDTVTSNKTLYAKWTEKQVVRKIRVGSTDYNLTVNPDKDYEYTTTLSSVTAGTQLNYYEDSSLVATSAKAVGNNNMTSSKTVLVNATNVSVYVDISAKTIWLGGMPLGGFHMIINGSRLVHMSDGGEYEGYTQYKSEMIAFSVNDTIQTVDCGGASSLPAVFTITNIVASGLGSNFTVVDGVLKCTTAVSARVFMKMRYDRNEIYFGDVEEYVTNAINFASGFNTAISAKCSSTGATNVSQLASAWSGQVTLFTALQEESRNYLKDITGEESPILATFLEKYMYVATKYKTQLGNNYNFLSKTIPSGSNFIPMTTLQTNASTTIIAVVVVGVAGLVVGGYFLLRKKKEN